MEQTDISDVLTKLKSLSDSSDIIIYKHNRENEQIDKWFSIIKETANAIINDTNCSKVKVSECPIPKLLSVIKGEQAQTKKNRVSSLLAAVQKNHARLSHRKSRTSLRKIILEKKSGNKWEISGSKLSDHQKISDSPHIKIPKSFANESNDASTLGTKKSANNETENCYSTPLQNDEILVPNSDDKTPVTRSKTRDIVNINPAATVVKKMKQISNKKYCTLNVTPDILQSRTNAKKGEALDAQACKNVEDSAVSHHTPKIEANSNSTPQNETIILDSSDSGESVERKPRTRSKRKSSIQLVQDKAKKTKNSSSESHKPKRLKPVNEDHSSESQFVKKAKLNKNAQNAVIQPKNSGISLQQIAAGNEKRILREIQKKEDTVSLNTKKLRSMRQMKIEESKKMRELKMENAKQQRLKIESEKKERMKCRSASKQENIHHKELSAKKTVQRKVQAEEKTDSVKKVTPSKKINQPIMPLQDEKTASSTPKKAPPKPARTPVKSACLSPEKQSTEDTAKAMNQTFTNSSVEVLSSDKEVFVKPSPLNSTYVAKVANLTSTPTVKKTESKTITKTPVSSSNKKNTSYTMTPSESSFVSYDVSEIKSDDSDEEESSNNKPIPSWASGVRLRNALLNQQYNPIDTSEMFGNYFETPDLPTIMGVEKKHYFKRTSSAIWINSPNRSLLY